KRVRYTLQHANEQGLQPADYTSPLIDSEVDGQNGNAAAAYDIELTAALLRYAHDVRIGRLRPAAVYNDVDLPPKHYDAVTDLSSALQSNSLDSFLDDLPPSRPEYRRLA